MPTKAEQFLLTNLERITKTLTGLPEGAQNRLMSMGRGLNAIVKITAPGPDCNRVIALQVADFQDHDTEDTQVIMGMCVCACAALLAGTMALEAEP